MTANGPADVDQDLRDRLRRGQTTEQLYKVGGRTGWWTEDDVDRVAMGDAPPTRAERFDQLTEQLTEQLVAAGVVEAPPPLIALADDAALDAAVTFIDGMESTPAPVEPAPTKPRRKRAARPLRSVPAASEPPAAEPGDPRVVLVPAAQLDSGEPAARTPAGRESAPWVWDPASRTYVDPDEQTASSPVEKEDIPQVRTPSEPVDILALGLEHPHPAIRGRAKLAARAIDELVTALARSRGGQ